MESSLAKGAEIIQNDSFLEAELRALCHETIV